MLASWVNHFHQVSERLDKNYRILSIFEYVPIFVAQTLAKFWGSALYFHSGFTLFKSQIDCSVAFPRSVTRHSLVGSHISCIHVCDFQPTQVVQLGVQFHGVFMSVRLHNLLFVMVPSDFGSGFTHQPTFENDFVGLFLALANNWTFCERGFNSSLGNRSFLTWK